jgi:hypothetical protein
MQNPNKIKLTPMRLAGQINKEWHLKNKMPKNPTLEERVNWHIEHTKNCSCREMPESIRKVIERNKESLK